MHDGILVALLIWSLAVGLSDLRRRIIPNALSLGACLLGVGVIAAVGQAASGAPASSAAWAAAFALLVTLPAYAMGKLGAGDVKYLVGIALLTGWPVTSSCFAIAGALGCAAGLLWLGCRTESAAIFLRGLPVLGSTAANWAEGFSKDPLRLPFGTLLSTGLWAVLIFKVAT